MGREGAVGVGVGADVPGHLQSAWFGQDAFLQKPTLVLQYKPLPQLALLPQVPPQVLGVPEGPGVLVGVTVGVVVGDSVGEPGGDSVGGVVERVNDRTQAGGAVTSAAWGILDGTFGATG